MRMSHSREPVTDVERDSSHMSVAPSAVLRAAVTEAVIDVAEHAAHVQVPAAGAVVTSEGASATTTTAGP